MKIKSLFELIIELLFQYLTMLLPRKNNLMLFGAWFGNKYDDNTRYLFEYICKNRNDIKAVWMSPNKSIVEQVKDYGLPVCYSRSLKAIFLTLRAKYAITVTHNQGRDLGPHLIKYMGGMCFINLWHGVAVKKVEYDDDFSKKILMSKKALFIKSLKYLPCRKDYYVATSEEIAKRYIGTFRSDHNHVLNLGQARNDYFYTEHVNPIRVNYPSQRLIVYMPTHRKEGKVQMNLSSLIDYSSLNEYCKLNGIVFLIKKHFYHRNENEPIEGLDNVNDITGFKYSTQEILDAADILITDYSSCYIDHLLLNRPQIFFGYDIDDYLSTDRGLYEDYTENVPGPICKDYKGLMSAIKDFINGIDNYKEIRKTKRDFYYSPENQCAVSKKQIEAILNL